MPAHFKKLTDKFSALCGGVAVLLLLGSRHDQQINELVRLQKKEKAKP
ncbi:hypothetical protein [Cohnella soli]